MDPSGSTPLLPLEQAVMSSGVFGSSISAKRPCGAMAALAIAAKCVSGLGGPRR